MTRFLRYRILIFLAFFSGGAIFPVTASPQETLIITGTGSSIGAMKLLAKSFQKKHPTINIDVLPSIGSVGSIKAVQEGKIHIGLTVCHLKPEEIRSTEIVQEPYAYVAFIFGVQRANRTKGLTLAEIEDIYAGKHRTWPDGTPVRIILRPLGDSYSVYLATISPGLKAAYDKAHSIPGVFVGGTDQEAAQQIERTPGSFGVTSSSVIATEQHKIRALSVDGAVPTLTNVSSGKYPYTMTLCLVYKKDQYKGHIKEFIEFVFSREGQKLLSDNGHVTLQRITGK